jgi:lysozyme family protein
MATTADIFTSAARWTLAAEGGWTEDTGGPTRYGLSQNAHPDVDLATLTSERAMVIYREAYWNPLGLDALPDLVAWAMLDAAVNCGQHQATKFLQGGVNDLCGREALLVDGWLGPKTKAAVRGLCYPDHALELCLAQRVCMRRVRFHASLAARKVYRPYLRGWVRRCARLEYTLARQWAARRGE